MTVRTWFRLLRASAWDAQPPLIQVYFRTPDPNAWRGPWTPPVSLFTFADYQALIERGAPSHALDDIRRGMVYGWDDTRQIDWSGFTK